MVVDPEAPFAVLPTTEQNGPSPSGWDFKAMSLITCGIPNRRGFDMLTSVGCMIDIATFEKDAEEVAPMVMEVGTDIGSNPVVNPNGVAKEEKRPTGEVMQITLIHLLGPSNLIGFELFVRLHMQHSIELDSVFAIFHVIWRV